MDSDSPDTLDARIAAIYGQDFVDFIDAITAPYQPRSTTPAPADTADCRKR